MRVFINNYKDPHLCVCVSTTTTSKKEEQHIKTKDEERKVPDPQESIEETPAVHFHPGSSKSDFREPSFEQQTYTRDLYRIS